MPTLELTRASTRDAIVAAPGGPTDPISVDDLPLPELEVEITTLAGHLAAATCRFLVLLASFDTRDGWGGAGMRSCAHWLSWRCGMSLSTAREHLRVAHAMATLPATTAAFTSGRLSYAKVRAITRVANPATESDLVDIALNAPAAHLDRLVSGLRRATTLAQDDQVAARAEHRHRWEDDGMLLVTVRLAPEDGATYLAALYAVRDALDERRIPADRHDQRNSPAGELPRAVAPAPTDQVDSPEQAFQATTLVQALVAMAETAAEHPLAEGPGGPRAEVVVHVDADVLTAPDPDPAAVVPLGLARCHLQDGPGLMPQTVRQLACDGGVVLAVRGQGPAPAPVLDIGRRTRRPNAAILRALWIRDQGCVHPGCGRRRRLQAHHVVHWAHGGPTALDNLLLLCRYHHRAVHRGDIDVRLDAGQARVVLTGGSQLAVAPPTSGLAQAVATSHDATITAETSTPADWLGDPLDVGYAVTALLDAWARRAPAGAG